MIDVIIPNYNKESTIPKTISSLSEQNNDLNILVVDDCSNDKSVEILRKKFPEAKVIRNKKNSGAAFCRNLGIKKTNSELLLFVDSDVMLKKNCLSELVQEMERKKLDIVFPSLVFENGRSINSMDDSAIFMMKRKSLEKMNYFFDENFYYLEDSEFFHRAMESRLSSGIAEKAAASHNNSSKTDCEKKFLLECKDTFYSLKNGLKIKDRILPISALKLLISAILNYNYFLEKNQLQGFGCSRSILLKHYFSSLSQVID